MFNNIFFLRCGMRYSKEHKLATKRRIVERACEIFATKGFEGTSIDEVMRACNLTRGGFYAHFRSKSALYREAIKLSAARRLAPTTSATEAQWIDTLFAEYLDAGTNSESSRSRWAFLAADIASDDPEVRSAYASAFQSISDKILGRMAGQFGCTEESSLSIAAMLIGASAVARTIDDQTLRDKLLSSCKRIATALIENKNILSPPNFFWEKEPIGAR